jgi:hypothetical protein
MSLLILLIDPLLEVVESLHNRLDEDLIAKELTQHEADTEDGFPEPSDIGK